MMSKMIGQADDGILIAKDELSTLIKEDKPVLILDIRKKTEGVPYPAVFMYMFTIS